MNTMDEFEECLKDIYQERPDQDYTPHDGIAPITTDTPPPENPEVHPPDERCSKCSKLS